MSWQTLIALTDKKSLRSGFYLLQAASSSQNAFNITMLAFRIFTIFFSPLSSLTPLSCTSICVTCAHVQGTCWTAYHFLLSCLWPHCLALLPFPPLLFLVIDSFIPSKLQLLFPATCPTLFVPPFSSPSSYLAHCGSLHTLHFSIKYIFKFFFLFYWIK